ncbi:host-nuclease inhibitor Gam family protein [Phycisphaerales bacterium AB-hyl4]|uniref:Host-nuclease inhibitor Gam family protein n=1 Tax=Natronomicrosphaera hydrolytica TaxID=3242702 RepID=A0ABV4U5A7_9BACT
MQPNNDPHHDESDSQKFEEAEAYGLPEQFEVRDDDSANWVLRKIVEARQYAQRVTTWAEQEKKRAEHQEAFFWNRFGMQLRRWTQRQIAERGGKRKSLDLPAGRVGFRAGKEKLVVCDETAAIAWADTHCPQAIQAKPRLLISELQQHLNDTGEVPEGVTVQPAGESFYVK